MPLDPSRPQPMTAEGRLLERVADLERDLSAARRQVALTSTAQTWFPTFPFYNGGADAGLPGNQVTTMADSLGRSSAIVVPAAAYERIVEPVLRCILRADSGNWTELVARVLIIPANASSIPVDSFVKSNQGAVQGSGGSGVDWRTATAQTAHTLTPGVGYTFVPQGIATTNFGGAYNRGVANSAFYVKRLA